MRRITRYRSSIRALQQSQLISTDEVVPTAEPVTAATYRRGTQERYSFRMLGINLDSDEWGKQVMDSWPQKCTFVVREILQTERSYIASLKEIILGYIMPLHGYLLSQGEGPNFIHRVFGNVVKLRQLHEQLLDDLYTACGDPRGFAQVFLETDFCQYREYCTHYTDANLFLQKSMEENEKLKLFITQCQHDLDHLLPLHSQLIKPVQRILKYKLMLHELLKYMDEEDVVYPDVKAALEKMVTVAEEINSSFDKQKSGKLATPSVIARKRSKEIKSLERSRSTPRRQTLPDKPLKPSTSDLQRSMEFEDSLTLLSLNKQTPAHQFNTVSPRRRLRPPLADLIGFFESPKPSQSTERLSKALSPPRSPRTPSPMAKSPSPISHDRNSAEPSNRSPSPGSSIVVQIQQFERKHTSSSDSAKDAIETPPENEASSLSTKAHPATPLRRKTPLSLPKSAPVVQRSKVEAQGEKGDRNSLRDTARSLLENSIDHTVKLSACHSNLKRSSSEEDGSQGLDIPPTALQQRSHSPPAVAPVGRTKRPLLPTKQAILPNKPPLGHTSHSKLKPRGKTSHPHQTVLPQNKKSKMDNSTRERFAIDMVNGQPVVSLPPSLQSPQTPQQTPSPPATTFYPSMLKPINSPSTAQSSRLALVRQEQKIEEMIRGGGGGGAKTSVREGGADGRKVPLLPPTVKKNTPSNQRLRRSSSVENIPMFTSP